jgi:hypothetical protein
MIKQVRNASVIRIGRSRVSKIGRVKGVKGSSRDKVSTTKKSSTYSAYWTWEASEESRVVVWDTAGLNLAHDRRKKYKQYTTEDQVS